MPSSMEAGSNINFDMGKMSGFGPEYYQRRQEINNSLLESGLFDSLDSQFQQDGQVHEFQVDLGSLESHERQQDWNTCAIASVRTMSKIAYPENNIPSESEMIELAKQKGFWDTNGGLNNLGALIFKNVFFEKPLPTVAEYAKEIKKDKYLALFTAIKNGYATMLSLSTKTLQQSLSKLNGEDVINPRYDNSNQHALIIMGAKINQEGRHCFEVFDPSADGVRDLDVESVIEEWSRYGFFAHATMMARAEKKSS